MTRYLPFIFISIALYTWFFFSHQEPEFLTAVPAEEKIIPLDFKKLAESKKPITAFKETTTSSLKSTEIPVETLPKLASQKELEPIKTTQNIASKKAAPITSPLENKKMTEDKKVIQGGTKERVITTVATVKSDNIKQLLASIKSTPASDVALIKSEFYAQTLPDLMLSPLPKKRQPRKNTTVNTSTEKITPEKESQRSAINDLLKYSQAPSSINKNDAIAKKTDKKPKRTFKKQAKAMEMTNELHLQQAIAVSGNKPHYPQEAKAAKQQGAVTVKFTVNMQGKTKKPQVITSSGHKALDTSVLDFIQKERFMPSLEGREKVTSEQLFFFDFSLQ